MSMAAKMMAETVKVILNAAKAMTTNVVVMIMAAKLKILSTAAKVGTPNVKEKMIIAAQVIEALLAAKVMATRYPRGGRKTTGPILSCRFVESSLAKLAF